MQVSQTWGSWSGNMWVDTVLEEYETFLVEGVPFAVLFCICSSPSFCISVGSYIAAF